MGKSSTTAGSYPSKIKSDTVFFTLWHTKLASSIDVDLLDTKNSSGGTDTTLTCPLSLVFLTLTSCSTTFGLIRLPKSSVTAFCTTVSVCSITSMSSLASIDWYSISVRLV